MAGLDPSIGLSALRAAQRGLEVVGHNMANATTPGYSRQQVQLTAARPEDRGSAGQVGTGVDVAGVRRAVDGLLDARLRSAQAEAGSAGASAGRLAELEAIIGRTDDGSIGSLLSRVFEGASALASRPEDATARASFVSDLGSLAKGLRTTHASLEAARVDIGAQADDVVKQVNGLVEQVAALDTAIVQSTTRGQSPNDLLDQRDGLIRDLAKLAGVQSTPRGDGGVRLTLGGTTLLSAGGRTTPLAAKVDAAGKTQVVEASSGRAVDVPSGELAGLRQAQDQAVRLRDGLDTLARGLAAELNRLSATGTSGAPPQQLVSANAVRDLDRSGDPTDDPLVSAGLPLPPAAGPTTITVGITDRATGVRAATQLTFDPRSGSLKDLAGALDGVTGLSATAGPDGKLRVVADSGYGVDFAGADADAGGVLGALGIQPMLTGSGAADLAVDAGLLADPGLLAAGLGSGAADGRNAARFAGLERASLAGLGGKSAVNFMAGLVADAGEASRSATGLQTATDSAVAGLESRREETSGVAVEEEVADLMRFERAFQAASQYLRVLDGLTEDLLGIVR